MFTVWIVRHGISEYLWHSGNKLVYDAIAVGLKYYRQEIVDNSKVVVIIRGSGIVADLPVAIMLPGPGPSNDRFLVHVSTCTGQHETHTIRTKIKSPSRATAI